MSIASTQQQCTIVLKAGLLALDKDDNRVKVFDLRYTNRVRLNESY